MILKELTLRNYCLYRGEQTLNLAPFGRNGKSKPITLFGGINGGGKTTLLDAVELALYGARARCAKRADGNYEQFLHECIHRGVDPSEGASVSLTFQYVSQGEEHVYELRRSWSLRRKRLRENIVVYKDGQLNRTAADCWNELIQELIPIGLSQLFFFDAEKIRFLAEDETGDATLGVSIKSLLGLDLAERLIVDAAVLENRLAERAELSEESGELQRLQAESQQHEEAVRAKKVERAGLENERLRAANELEQIEAERKLQTLRRKQIDLQIRGEEAARMVKLAIRTQSTMKDFLHRATAAKIDRLSGLITDSFRFLLRKQTLVETVHINPETFAITLFDDQGHAVPKKRLSEGEKQIFAISVLWGLAQASPRPLPAIIDTPMARLDAEHRNNLIKRYFPNASHQVIILSTDTEVDERYYRDLHPHIARAYHLNYDESAKITRAEEGYFWESQAVDHAAGA